MCPSRYRQSSRAAAVVGRDSNVGDTGERVDRAGELVGRIGPRGRLDEHERDVPGREGPGEAEPVAHEVEAVAARTARPPRSESTVAAELADRVERGLDVVEREQRDHHVRRAGHEPQPGGGDHREGALAPAQQARRGRSRCCPSRARRGGA